MAKWLARRSLTNAARGQFPAGDLIPALQERRAMFLPSVLIVSLVSYILSSLHSHISHASYIFTITVDTVPFCLGILETICFLFHYASLDSVEDK